MKSPFPGMDPWLENPSKWKGVHDTMLVKMMELMQPALKQRGYYIGLGERVWIADDERFVWPDNLIFKTGGATDDGGTAIVAVDEPIRILRVEGEVRENFAEIRAVGTHELVTCIELISQSNKFNQQGRDLYQQKQHELADAGVHLVEIDLLRAGMHILAVSLPVVSQLEPWDYLINLARCGSDEYEVYPIPLRQRLPRIRVPLKNGDEDAILDTQLVLDGSYDILPFPETLPYDREPVPPLGKDDAVWADEILQSKGLR